MLLEVPQHQYPRVFPVAGGGGRLRVLAALVTRVPAPGEELGQQWLRLRQYAAPDHLHPQPGRREQLRGEEERVRDQSAEEPERSGHVQTQADRLGE